MQPNEPELDLATNDLGPLAWVLDELRKSLESASAALRRFVRDAGLARGSDMASVDGGQLRIARQQLHQAVGALEMVGLGAPALFLRSMEAAVQRFIERPELCSEAAAAKVERSGFALAEYLEGVLLGKPASAVALFPQYRDTQELGVADRTHPADLWSLDWRWIEPQIPAPSQALVYDRTVRARMDETVLKIVRTGEVAAARELARISLSLAASQSARQPKIFWKICAGFFEAMALGLLPLDVYIKRAASRVLLQFASLAKGELGVSDRLAQDLVFFCSQAVPPQNADAPALAGVRQAWDLARFQPVDYQTPQYGRFDPVLLAQARKRIGVAKDTWSSLSGGDVAKLKGVAEQFRLVSDSLTKLHPASTRLAQALFESADTVARLGRPPSAELAMEVATAILYLEAAFEDLDPSDSQLAVRTARLADRLDTVRQDGQPEALEPWMEELYRRVSDRQTMGSVVGELRLTLSELEKVLDIFFRNPQDKAPLRDAPGHLSQMRGVLSVLGLDQAAQAVLRMREAVEEIISTEINEEQARAAGTFDKLGNNLGALGFLIDMLNYQPSLAKKLFVYDDERRELRPLMGRTGQGAPAAHFADGSDTLSQEVMSVVRSGPESGFSELTAKLDTLAAHAVLGEHTGIALSAREAAAAVSSRDEGAASAALNTLAATVQAAPARPAEPTAVPQPEVEEDDLRDIFLEEAREVVQNGLVAVGALGANPSDLGELTTLRRAFHTLKGSSRMVGLTEFGEAAWSLEQVFNTLLADQKPAGDGVRSLAGNALRGFGLWTEDIASNSDGAWKASLFRGPADAMRTEQRLLPLDLPQSLSGSFEAELPTEVAEPADSIAMIETIEVFDVASQVPGPSEAVTISEPAAETASAEPPSIPGAEWGHEPAARTIPFDATQIIRAESPAEAVEIFEAELPADFDFPGDPGQVRQPAATAPVAPIEVDGIDFAGLIEAAGEAPFITAKPHDGIGSIASDPLSPPDADPAAETFTFTAVPAAALSPTPIAQTGDPDQPAAIEFEFGQLPDPAPVEPAADALDLAAAADEQVKVIGSLRIGIPLYNVYLNEADEWSRRLLTEVTEWALELNRQVSDTAVGLAHALAGSSATVGFHALSDIARALESALEHTRSLAHGTPAHGKAFTDAAEEIRRLLHQFAAGFLKEPDSSIAPALRTLKELDLPTRADVPEDDLPSDFAELGVAAVPSPDSAEATATGPNLDAVFEAEAEAGPASGPPAALESPSLPNPDPVRFELPTVAPVALRPMAATVPMAPMTALASLDDDQDEIDVADAIDPDLFPIFEEEALELMPQLGGALRQWSARPDNRSARDEVLRALHTLKGSARLAGALRLGELAHHMESEIESLGSDNLSAASLEPLLHRFDNLQGNFDSVRASGLVGEIELGAGAETRQSSAQAEFAQPGALLQPTTAQDSALPVRALLAMPATTTLVPVRAASNQAVRVRSQLLDRLVNQAGEVMITRSRLEAELGQLRGSLTDLTGNLDRLRSQLRDIELQAESQMQSRLAQAKDSAVGFDPLEFDRFTRVQELTRMMAESVNDVATVQRNLQRTVESTEDDLIAQARQTRELQRDLLRTRMVEFEGISDRLYRVVRQASKETGKQIKLDITGGSIEMDRGVLDRMTPAFEHLLRNCVAHGVEDPATRQRAGKEAVGTILIGLHHEGNDVSVEFQDDGAGLNLPRIREKALQQGLIGPDQELSDADAANLIFMPGFSTAVSVTELAGRGIGMDVVRSEVDALGGRIETTSEAGKGTRFKLVLPLTTAVTQVVMIRTGNLAIGVPANLIEIVRRAPAKDVQQAYNTGSYEFGGESLPFYWSGALLQASPRSAEPQGKTLPVVVFKSAAQRIAVHVDEVLGNQEVVVKNLGPQLARLPGLAGMTVLASGAVVLIYNPVALGTVFGEQARRMSADRAQPDILGSVRDSTSAPTVAAPASQRIPLVLVVDDSITVRRVTQRLLQREGYRVTMAADGLQALERLAEEKPTVVLSDIEMPRMDGFDLVRNIRADARLADLPVIMITSRIAEKHRERARELEVDHYLGKPYSEDALLSLIKHYCVLALTA